MAATGFKPYVSPAQNLGKIQIKLVKPYQPRLSSSGLQIRTLILTDSAGCQQSDSGVGLFTRREPRVYDILREHECDGRVGPWEGDYQR